MDDASRRHFLALLASTPLLELPSVLNRPSATIQTQKVREWPYRETGPEFAPMSIVSGYTISREILEDNYYADLRPEEDGQ